MTERKGADGRPSAFLPTIRLVSESVRALIEAYDAAWNRQDLDALTRGVVLEHDVVGVERAERFEILAVPGLVIGLDQRPYLVAHA